MTSFVECARARQTLFRDTSDTISEECRSPTDEQGKRYGHLLAFECEEENLYPSLRGKGGALSYFSERDIAWSTAAARNMNSSQIMCVNFMLPLAEVTDALKAIVRTVDDDVEGVVDINHAGQVSPVEFEWIGIPRSLEGGMGRGAYNTSVDAFVVAETDTARRAYLIEWKYTEGPEYRVDDYKSVGRNRDTYSTLYRADTSSFNCTVPMDELLYDPFRQLMRLRLLGDRMVAEQELGVSDAKVVVVVPDCNLIYRERITSPPLAERFPDLGTVSGVFRATLKNPDRAFATVSPSLLLEAVERECGQNEKVSDWAAYMRERYGL